MLLPKRRSLGLAYKRKPSRFHNNFIKFWPTNWKLTKLENILFLPVQKIPIYTKYIVILRYKFVLISSLVLVILFCLCLKFADNSLSGDILCGGGGEFTQLAFYQEQNLVIYFWYDPFANIFGRWKNNTILNAFLCLLHPACIAPPLS